MNTHHHPFRGEGPDFHPLYDHDLDALVRAAQASDDFFEHRSIERRITQAVPGMTTPLHCASADVQARARRAVHLFRQLVNGDEAARSELRAHLHIEQPELSLHPLHVA